MRNAKRSSLARWLLVAMFAAGGLGAVGCGARGLPSEKAGSGGAGVVLGAAGAGGQAMTGVGGAAGLAASCTGASDARLVIAGQRILRLTMNETLNTVRYLVGDEEATALVTAGIIGVGDDSSDLYRRFPPLVDQSITDVSYPQLDQIADHVGKYVTANLACRPTATDECATQYLNKLTARAYRRPLTSDEQARFTALYTKLRNPQIVNGYQVTFTVEEATGYAVNALLRSPQMLWRWELGDPALSGSAAGIPLTEQELATQLAFFLTDEPPDDTLLGAASAGRLRANLTTYVDYLLESQNARDWLRTILETYLRINTLPDVVGAVDPTKFPIFTPSLASDMRVEARMFLDEALWNGNLTDLLVSRTAFINATLAANIYAVPVPAGASATSFAQTTLPADQRAGLLTNAAFLTTRARSDGHGLVVPRGVLVATALLCMPPPGPDDVSRPPDPGPKPFAQQTSQEQVAARAARSSCRACHGQFDPYGLALDNYDNLGRYRTVDDLGQPVDARTALPAALGGDAVANGVQLAAALATKPAFTSCMARTLLQYALVDPNVVVDVPLNPQQPGCATADVAQRYRDAGGKTFTDLVHATVAAPAFLLRRAAP